MDLSKLFFTGRWILARVDGLVFPATCVGCGDETDRIREFSGPAKASVAGVLRQFAGYSASITVTAPFCESCQRSHQRRRWIWTAVGVLVGGIFGAALAATMRPEQLVADAAWHFELRSLALVVPLVLGALGGWHRGDRQLPLRLRDYSKKEGTVRIAFRRPEIANQFEDLMLSSRDAEREGGDPANHSKRRRKRRKR